MGLLSSSKSSVDNYAYDNKGMASDNGVNVSGSEQVTITSADAHITDAMADTAQHATDVLSNVSGAMAAMGGELGTEALRLAEETGDDTRLLIGDAVADVLDKSEDMFARGTQLAAEASRAAMDASNRSLDEALDFGGEALDFTRGSLADVLDFAGDQQAEYLDGAAAVQSAALQAVQAETAATRADIGEIVNAAFEQSRPSDERSTNAILQTIMVLGVAAFGFIFLGKVRW